MICFYFIFIIVCIYSIFIYTYVCLAAHTFSSNKYQSKSSLLKLFYLKQDLRTNIPHNDQLPLKVKTHGDIKKLMLSVSFPMNFVF